MFSPTMFSRRRVTDTIYDVTVPLMSMFVCVASMFVICVIVCGVIVYTCLVCFSPASHVCASQLPDGGFHFACDQGKHRNTKRYDFWRNFCSSPPCPKSYTQNRTV